MQPRQTVFRPFRAGDRVQYARPLYDDNNELVRAIGPAATTEQLAQMFKHRSSYARELQAGEVTPAHKVPCGTLKIPAQYEY